MGIATHSSSKDLKNLTPKIKPRIQQNGMESWADIQEMGRRAEVIYEDKLRDIVETDENIGKFLTLDVYSGDYEIGADRLDPADLVRARKPDAYLCTFRIGYQTGDAIGTRLKRRAPRAN